MKWRKIWKSDSVTFKLDQFLYLTSWKLWSKKSKRFSFLSSNIRVCYRKIATIYTYLAKVALLSLISGKIHEMSHYHYVTLLKRYSQIFLRWKVLSVKIVQFLWGQNHIILLKKSLNSFSESNFAQDSFQMSNVTLSHQPIWQTVQIHVLGHNFFIWGRAWTYDISTCSVWHLWEFQCIFGVELAE